MKMLPIVVAAILGTSVARASAQESGPQQEPPRGLERLREPDRRRAPEDRSDDLWYGASGVRPGGDLLGPVLDLIRKPSGLLDFRPRKVRSYLADRETEECFRERR